MQYNLPPESMGQDDGLVVVVTREITARAGNHGPTRLSDRSQYTLGTLNLKGLEGSNF
jgi:hypothetical protein